jgi:hypothetical protein
MSNDVREIKGKITSTCGSTSRPESVYIELDGRAKDVLGIDILQLSGEVTLLVPAPPKPRLLEMVRPQDVMLRGGQEVVFIGCGRDGDPKLLVPSAGGCAGVYIDRELFEEQCTFLRPGPGAVYEDGDRCLYFVVPSNSRHRYLIARRQFDTATVDIDIVNDLFSTRKDALRELYRRAQAGEWTRVDEVD